MLTVRLVDSLFGHAEASNNGALGIRPKLIKFDRSKKWRRVVFYTDLDLDKASKSMTQQNYAWIIESPDVHSDAYNYISDSKHYQNYHKVLTCSKKLLDTNRRFLFTPVGGSWIRPSERRIYKKEALVSIIVSPKRDLEGHKLRHDVVNKFGSVIDRNNTFGKEYNWLEEKIDGLKKYQYSIIIENCREDYYFTEKLIDCFSTGTVPIYWGCPSIGEFFDIKGILSFTNLTELKNILSFIGDEDYQNRLNAIEGNFIKSQDYLVTEDWIAMNILKQRRRSRIIATTLVKLKDKFIK